jgi:hypothetical protein
LAGTLGEFTHDEIAAELSAEEGRPVGVSEVRMIEFKALRKVRRALDERGLTIDKLLPG